MGENILEALFNGEIDPLQNFSLTLPEYRKIAERWYEDEQQFMQSLTEEQCVAFELLMEGHLALRPQELCNLFIDGFKLAVKIMAEVYNR